MKNKKQLLHDSIFFVLTLIITFALNLLLQTWFNTQTLIPMIFVLGVFLISWRTQGYFWRIAASLVSVLAYLSQYTGKVLTYSVTIVIILVVALLNKFSNK